MEDKDRSRKVKSFFENPEIYLTYDYNLRIRLETVKGFIGDDKYPEVLDMPCGNGLISAPLIDGFDRLTMIDFSSRMMELARENVPSEKRKKVRFVCSDFYDAEFEEGGYDLIISLGILAHINDPMKFIGRLQKLVRPGGEVIIQNTDSKHFYSYLIRVYLGVRRLFGKDRYKVNKVPGALVLDAFRKKGFELKNTYRYNQSFLGFSRLFSNEAKYNLTRKFFGNEDNNRHAWWGSDVIYYFKKVKDT